MYDITLPKSEVPILGFQENDTYFNEHLAEWEQEVLTKLIELNYPAELWPSTAESRLGFIRRWKGSGYPRTMAPLNLPLDKTPYAGHPMPDAVMEVFNKSFELATESTFCITRGEEWWPYDKTFACTDAESYMQGILYLESVVAGQLVAAQPVKKQGRPANTEAKLLKAQKRLRYQQWLSDCEAYKVQLAELRANYQQAMAAYSELKEQGAPKWEG